MRLYFTGFLAAAALFGQNPSAKPAFEVASIKPSAPDEFDRSGAGMHLDGSQASWKYLSLHNYISAAYLVKSYQIVAPDWMASARFDITAKFPPGAAPKDIGQMLQTLLEDRFHITTHRENKEFPVYALVPAKSGVKMQESPANSKTGAHTVAVEDTGHDAVDATSTRQSGGVTITLGNGTYYSFANNKLEGHKMPAARIADVLSGFMDRPVVDMTNLQGSYDFVLELAPLDFVAMGVRAAASAGAPVSPQALQLAERSSGDSLIAGLEKLGLKLESRKAPVETLVIDHADKTPTGN
jgi:uncharacterized protein (TIGR03435 family)